MRKVSPWSINRASVKGLPFNATYDLVGATALLTVLELCPAGIETVIQTDEATVVYQSSFQALRRLPRPRTETQIAELQKLFGSLRQKRLGVNANVVAGVIVLRNFDWRPFRPPLGQPVPRGLLSPED